MNNLKEFLPSLSFPTYSLPSLPEGIFSDEQLSLFLDPIRRTTERTVNLIKPEGKDWRDPWLATQALLAQKAILKFVSKQRNRGGIILLLGTMGAGKTTLLFRTIAEFENQGWQTSLWAPKGEERRFREDKKKVSTSRAKSADNLEATVSLIESPNEIKRTPNSIIGINEVFLLCQQKDFRSQVSALTNLIRATAEDHFFLILDVLSSLPNNQVTPVAKEIMNYLKKEKVPSISIFLLAKCSFFPSLFATHLIRFSASSEGKLILPNPEEIILSQTETATVKPGSDFFFPVSELALKTVTEKAGYHLKENDEIESLFKEASFIPLVKLNPPIKEHFGFL